MVSCFIWKNGEKTDTDSGAWICGYTGKRLLLWQNKQKNLEADVVAVDGAPTEEAAAAGWQPTVTGTGKPKDRNFWNGIRKTQGPAFCFSFFFVSFSFFQRKQKSRSRFVYYKNFRDFKQHTGPVNKFGELF